MGSVRIEGDSMRDSVVFYRSFWEAIKEADPPDQLAAYNAIFDYALDGIEPNVTGAAAVAFIMAKPQIDANNRRYENGKKGAKYGKLGGRPRKEKNPKKTPKEPQENPTETPNVNVNDNVNVNVNDKERDTPSITNDNTVITNDNRVINKRFAPPSLEEVRAYCTERNNNVDPEAFIDFYESKGWKVGNQTMKDWKASVRTWERRSRDKPTDKPKEVPKGHFANERIYDFEEIERKYVKGAK